MMNAVADLEKNGDLLDVLDTMVGDYEYEVSTNGDMESRESKPLLDTHAIRAPSDRKYIVFFIFGFLGLASLLPWNFFITAKKYFDYKFRNTSLSSDVAFDDPAYETPNQVAFESDLSIVSNGSNLLFSIITAILAKVLSVKKRIVGSSLFILAMFIATTVMVKVDTDSWQDGFLTFTLVIATFISGGQSVFTSSVLGLSAIFPPIYSQSAMIGQAAGGTFSALISIITHWTGGDAISSAFIYFLIASAVTILAILVYIALYFLKFSKFFMSSRGTKMHTMSHNTSTSVQEGNRGLFFWIVFKKIWLYLLSVGIVFLVSLSVFPAVCSLIKAKHQDSSAWSDYFTPVVCFLIFNLSDFLGRLLTFVSKFPGNQRPKLMLLLTILRAGLVPLLMMCNAQPRHHLPVYLDHDCYPIIFISLLGLTNGYLGTLCMSFGPVHLEMNEAEVGGIMLAIAMTVGLAFGSFLSALLVKLL